MIKNYTSTVPVERTISRIELILVKCGAMNIVKDYDNGQLKAIFFAVSNPQNNQRIIIRLPANSEAVYQTLTETVKRPRQDTFKNLRHQADRTAWKLMQDWVEIQLSLIEMNQVEFLQVFLPYVWDGQKTFYTALKESGFKMLEEHK